MSYCVKEHKECIGWAEKYFKDCLCNAKDEVSFGFGLISLVCWGVAEIPQIITNFRSKSGHGISLFFLLTWIAGDIFNLAGCLLEPATLPTQLYTAVLYTTTTVVLVIQSLYYDYFRRWRKQLQPDTQVDEDMKKPLRPHKPTDHAIPIPSRSTTRRSETYYYTSARSMAGSTTPPIGSYLWPIKSGPSALGRDNDSSSDDDDANPIPPSNTASRPKPIPRSLPVRIRSLIMLLSVFNHSDQTPDKFWFIITGTYMQQAGYSAFLAASINMPQRAKGLVQLYIGRKLLQEGRSESVFGQWLGWMMAAIYMGGRIPQIWLNIKRGSVEGLNPLMFIFALAANATYVGSILVRSTEWSRIKANLPWLLDAFGCVLLDLFIILQYVYYRYLRKESCCTKQEYGDCIETAQ